MPCASRIGSASAPCRWLLTSSLWFSREARRSRPQAARHRQRRGSSASRATRAPRARRAAGRPAGVGSARGSAGAALRRVAGGGARRLDVRAPGDHAAGHRRRRAGAADRPGGPGASRRRGVRHGGRLADRGRRPLPRLRAPPLAQQHRGGRARATLRRSLPLRPETAPAYSSVIGTTPPGQLRRGFLAYVERERAHPYRPFLHYNSWYDLGYFNSFDEAGALGVIEAFGTELHLRRGVQLDSFLFDDGWDDPHTLWRFNAGFPHGFTPLREAAARYGAAPGVWMSPWGGYGDPHEQRLRYGREQGFETNAEGFALSGPRYYARFRETALDMIRTYGVNQFKIDGTGSASSSTPGSRFDSDFDAAIGLIAELRAEKPDLYVNLTTGTYPSPFWLRYADSTWRGGDDHAFAGVGTDRQRWITYRDGDTLRRRGAAGAALPPQRADAARDHLRPARPRPDDRPGGRLHERGPRLLRHGDAAPGDVRHPRAPHGGELGRARARRRSGRAATPPRWWTRTGSGAIPGGSSRTGGPRGRRRRRRWCCGTRRTRRSASRWTLPTRSSCRRGRRATGGRGAHGRPDRGAVPLAPRRARRLPAGAVRGGRRT